ncbi:GNAT family N-acetyltransferase [Planococcus sp. CPCC 101016]|uniref:GNAT family N-acetyltransferase n=1 Tax=Planococcus sp. CPCC 101016 TaxID=2599617 RepID=UPI0011B77067|nr:GNAT family N-acetyltransferase [Planococcus sp. CPCC 101016]TWT07692.1 GNAT family N-acetyltransferase [Planococcus sp. CPCC 101016]
MRLFNNIDLAREIENIKIKGTKEYIVNRKKISPIYTGDYLALHGKGYVFSMEKYFFSVGFGLKEEVSSSDIKLIENFVLNKNILPCPRVHFEVTPYSDPLFLTIIQEKGYTLDHFLSVWVLDLEAWAPTDTSFKSDEVSIIRVATNQAYEWAKTVASGIAEDNTATEDSIESIRCFFNVPDTEAFLLKDNDQSVAGGFLMLNGQLGELFLTSTIHSHRGMGYQNLLIEERIKYAKSRGCTYLTVTTKPNNTSARNMERNGFKLGYNKAIMKSPLLNSAKHEGEFN